MWRIDVLNENQFSTAWTGEPSNFHWRITFVWFRWLMFALQSSTFPTTDTVRLHRVIGPPHKQLQSSLLIVRIGQRFLPFGTLTCPDFPAYSQIFNSALLRKETLLAHSHRCWSEHIKFEKTLRKP